MKTLTKICITTASMVALGTLFTSCESSDSDSTSGSDSTLRRVSSSQIPSLGSATSFAVFGGGAGITNQGVNTIIDGDIGTTGASTMITGFHSASFNYAETPLNVGAVNGSVITDAPQGSPADFALAKSVANDALNAYNKLAAIPGGIDPGAGLLEGLTLFPGVYKSSSGSFLLVGSDLTLDAQGDPDAIWVFQMESALTVGSPAAPRSVILVNGAQARNIYWQVGSSATINGAGGGTMAGTILATSGATISDPGSTTSTTLNGRALALFGAVTMVNAVINIPSPASAPRNSVAAINKNQSIAHVLISGTNAANVAAVADQGTMDIVNNGGHVAATEIGSGTIDILNDGGVLTATNTGNGTMTIRSTATGAVTVTNTGNGNVTVNASGDQPITLTHTGDEDFNYPASSGIARR
ncbi:MAG: DUF3494 domain-containing protein [Fibrobacteres bacterium]|nr:DUF3494 domain-containing protein [Fibrobacterota bacterium]